MCIRDSTFPWSITTMPSARRSASSRYWVDRRMVVPSETSAAMGIHRGAGLRGDYHPADHPVPRGGGPSRRRHRGDRPREGDRAGDRRSAQIPGGWAPVGIHGVGRRRVADPAGEGRAAGGRRTGDRRAVPLALLAGPRRSRGAARRAAEAGRLRCDAGRCRPAASRPGRRLPYPHRSLVGGHVQQRQRGRRVVRRCCTGPIRPARPEGSGPVTTLAQAVGDGAVITKRNLLKIKRVPELLVFATLSPIMFVLLFAFIFGSAIPLPGVDYKEFLMAGIFTQTVVFGSTITGASLAEDLQKGLIDRFRSLPMARSAVLVGRTNADIGNNIVTIFVMAVTGLLVGWRIRTSVLEALAAFGLLLLFAYAICDLLVDGAGRALGEIARGGAERLVHHHLPVDVHREHLRAHGQLPSGAESFRGLEPGVVGDPGSTRTVRQHQSRASAA